MKTRLLTAALAVCTALVLGGCASPANEGGNSAGGSLAISRDDALLYAADGDRDALFVIDARTEALVAEVKVGRQPEKVLVAPDDTVYVTNRLGRSVSVLRRGETTESARLDVGVEPVGLAASADGRTLYVVSATSLTDTAFGTLTAFDTRTLGVLWEVPVGHEPRGIALVAGDRAIITQYKDGDATLVDLKQGAVLKAGTDAFTQMNQNALGLFQGNDDVGAPRPLPPPDGQFGVGPQTQRLRGLEAILPSRDGRQVFIAGQLSTDTVLQVNATTTTDPKEPFPGDPSRGGSGYGGGSCGATAVSSPAVITFGAALDPQVSDTTSCGFDGADRPPLVISSNVPGVPVQGPVALAMDPTGSFLFIANRESNNVSVVVTTSKESSSRSGIDAMPMGREVGFGGFGSAREVVAVGAGPSGVVTSADGLKAWVYNGFDHSLSRLERVNGRVQQTALTRLAADVLPADVVAGRKLFFSAVDARMNNPGTGIACATCHLEGREDGHVWNFPDGPRQTPSLAGRMTMKTAPFHWNGEFVDLTAFMSHTIQRRMGGTGVTPAMERQLGAFITSMPAADNPMATATPADVLARGRVAFEKAQCQSCHQGETLSDTRFFDVGTYVTGAAVNDDLKFLPNGGLNTPSLLGLGRTAPYLHDGSAQTLKARLLQGKAADKHGLTSSLTAAEVDDLSAYLKAL